MALSQRLDLRQTQALVMTPQLQQAIKLLQLSNLELSTFIEGELEQNPLLERDETPTEGSAEPRRRPKRMAATRSSFGRKRPAPKVRAISTSPAIPRRGRAGRRGTAPRTRFRALIRR